MGRKKKTLTPIMSDDEVKTLQKEYIDEINTNHEYSLEVDPTNKYKMSQPQKDFIKHYVNFKSIATAAELSCLDMDTAKAFFVAYDTQLEIRRIHRALYQRQFTSKLLSMDDIAGYLSSLLTDENVPLADQLKTTEKLRVVELILKLNELKAQSLVNPNKLMQTNIESEIKQLSVQSIQRLLTESAYTNDKKNETISKLDDGTLSVEEKAYLSSLPVDELLKLL